MQSRAAAGFRTVHNADLNADFSLELGELLRVSQIHNLGHYACNFDPNGSEDGYRGASPDAAPQNWCPMHDSDFAPADREITLNELLRAIQFFNTDVVRGGNECGDTEDGFCNPGHWHEGE